MAFRLSKEEVSKLSEEQRASYARLVLSEAKYERALLGRAKGYFGRGMPQFLAIIVLCVYLTWQPEGDWIPIALFLMAAFAIEWHASGVNRRIDAVIQLLNLDGVSESAEISPPQGD